MTLDRWLFREFNAWAGVADWFDGVIRFVAGDHLFLVAATLVLVWLWLSGRDEGERSDYQRSALAGVAALGIASALASVIALLVGHQRPFAQLENVEMLFYQSTDPSFPAHPVAVLVAIGVCVYRSRTRMGTMLIASGVVLGVARIIAGVFWPSDVLGGIVLGLLVGAATFRILDRVEPIPSLVTRGLLGTPPSAVSRERQLTH